MNKNQSPPKLHSSFAVALLLVSIGAAQVQASVYSGTFINGNDGGAYSYGHTAVSYSVGQNNHLQLASGSVVGALDPNASFNYSFQDNGAAGLSDGDTLSLNFSVPFLSYFGNVFSTHTLGGQIGTVDFNGFFTVGGPSSPTYTHGISGTGDPADVGALGTGYLDYVVNFTDSSTAGGFQAGDKIVGRMYAQARAHTRRFNGISADNLSWAIWGDNRPPSPNFFDASNPDTSMQLPDGALIEADGTVHDNYGFGWDLVVESQLAPEPGGFVVWSLFLLLVVVSTNSRKRT